MPLLLPYHLPAAHLHLPRQRDEAHRFAITYHRKRARKELLTSALDQVTGIGKVRRQRLLQHFTNLEALKGATVGLGVGAWGSFL